MRNFFRVIFAYAYGPWIALVYFSFKRLMGTNLVGCFSAGALIGGILLAIVGHRSFLVALRSRITWVRAFAFALTQLFIFKALSSGETSAVFASSSVAILVTLPLSKVFLREAISRRELIAASIAISGLLLMSPHLNVTTSGFFAGIFQALSVVSARKAGMDRTSLLGNVTMGLLIGGLVCLSFSHVESPELSKYTAQFLISAVLIVSTQVYFIWLSFGFPASVANQISQTRIVWSVAIESVVLWKLPQVGVATGSLLVFFGALIVSFSGASSLTLNSKLAEEGNECRRA